MKRRNYRESGVPEHLRVRVRYIRDRRWFTACDLLDKDNVIVASGYSTCSYKDQPRRKIGRAIAVGRALKEYWRETDECSRIDYPASDVARA